MEPLRELRLIREHRGFSAARLTRRGEFFRAAAGSENTDLPFAGMTGNNVKS